MSVIVKTKGLIKSAKRLHSVYGLVAKVIGIAVALYPIVRLLLDRKSHDKDQDEGELPKNTDINHQVLGEDLVAGKAREMDDIEI